MNLAKERGSLLRQRVVWIAGLSLRRSLLLLRVQWSCAVQTHRVLGRLLAFLGAVLVTLLSTQSFKMWILLYEVR